MTACIHCGTFFNGNRSEKFCCAGCEFVFGLIKSSGLDHYYDLKNLNPPACPIPAGTPQKSGSYAYLDSHDVRDRLSPDGRHLRLYLEGLNCSACLWLLEQLPKFCDSAESARVNLAECTIEVTRRKNGSFEAIAETLNRFGHRPRPLSESDAAHAFAKKEMRRELTRIGVAAAATGNIMILAVSLYGGATGALAYQFKLLSATLALPVLSYCAWPFYRSALAGVRARNLNLDIPIVAALISGICMSIWALVSDSRGDIYFDSLSMLVLLLLSSRFFLKSLQRRQLSAVHLEDELLFSGAHRFGADGNLTAVSASSLQKGDVIRMTSETTLQVDGIVRNGSAFLDSSVLTGESDLSEVTVGSRVEAGCRIVSGSLDILVEKIPRETRLAQVLRDTERAVHSRPKIVQLSDKVSQWFIALTFIAAFALVLFFASTNPAEGISRALALIIVTCPCVFGIAIPLSMSFAVRAAASEGAIIKNPEVVERLWQCRRIFFDKTGTLTTGAMSVSSIESDSDAHLAVALAMEQDQQHPAAKAITAYLKRDVPACSEMGKIESLPSGGVTTTFGKSTFTLKAIEPAFPTDTSLGQNIRLSFALFENDRIVSKFHLGDSLRPSAETAINWARRQNFEIGIVSGDRKDVVSSVARALKISPDGVLAERTPEMKAAVLASSGRGTIMIGDGVNDAAALASADVGIAITGSLDISLRAADIYLTRADLNLISRLLEISRKTKNAIIRNLGLSVSFNVVSGTLAATGYMHPLFAAVLMPLSSFTVLLSASWTFKRLSRGGPRA